MKATNNRYRVNGRALSIKTGLYLLSFILGIMLMSINLYGLSQHIRKPELGVLDHNLLRFVPKEVWSYSKSMKAIDSLGNVKQRSDLVQQANKIVNRSLVHVDWYKVDPKSYRELVPIWDNYFLYLIGKFSGLEQFERYHYSDYKRTIRRGIGICGDASITLSSILDRYHVPNKIVSFKGHVIVEYTGNDGKRHLIDPDFGVSLGVDLDQLKQNPEIIKSSYLGAGYSQRDLKTLLRVYSDKRGYTVFDDTYHFMKKRYLFERVSYIAKWLLPILLLIVSIKYFLGIWRFKSTEAKAGS